MAKRKQVNNAHTAITRIKQISEMHTRLSVISDALFGFYLDFSFTDTHKELDSAFAKGDIKSLDDLRKFFDSKCGAISLEAEQLVKTIK